MAYSFELFGKTELQINLLRDCTKTTMKARLIIIITITITSYSLIHRHTINPMAVYSTADFPANRRQIGNVKLSAPRTRETGSDGLSTAIQ